MISRDVRTRPSAATLLQDPFFSCTAAAGPGATTAAAVAAVAHPATEEAAAAAPAQAPGCVPSGGARVIIMSGSYSITCVVNVIEVLCG